MTRWQLVAGPATQAPSVELTKARDRKVTWRLREPSTLTFTLDGRHPQAAELQELATDVHLLRDGEPAYTGRIGQSAHEIGDSRHTVTYDTADTRALLGRRLWTTEPYTDYTNTEQATVAKALVDHTQGLDGGNLGIATTGLPTTGALTTRRVNAGASILDELTWLAQVGDPDAAGTPGFDWDITPGWTDRTLQLWYPTRGTDRGVVYDYTWTGTPRTSLVSRLSRTFDPSTYANAIRVSGGTATDTSVATTPLWRSAAGLASALTHPEGRWDASLSYADVVKDAELAEKADERLGFLAQVVPAYRIGLRSGAWNGPDALWLGDTIRLRVRSGVLDEDTTLRVQEVDVTLGESGEEDVSLTVGEAPGSVLSRIHASERRLAVLERRAR